MYLSFKKNTERHKLLHASGSCSNDSKHYSSQTHHTMCGTQADDPPAHGLWNLKGSALSGNAGHAGNGWPGGPARPPGAPKSSARLNRVWSAWATKPQEHLDTLRPALPVTSCHILSLPMTFFQKKTQKTSLHRAWSLSGRLLALPLEPGPAPWPSERPHGPCPACPGCQGGARTSIVGVSKARDKRKYHEIWLSDCLIACDQRYNQNQSEMSNMTIQFLIMTVVEPSVLSPSATALLESGSSHPGEAHVYSEFDASECKAMHLLSHTISHRKSSSYPISTLGQTD